MGPPPDASAAAAAAAAGAGDELPSSESDVLDITEFDLCALWRAGVFAVDCFVACLVPVRGTQKPPPRKVS